VRVPERQQPKAQAHSEGFLTKDIDEKTCRKRQVLRQSERLRCREAEKLAAVGSLYHEELADKAGLGITGIPLKKRCSRAALGRLAVIFRRFRINAEFAEQHIQVR
jgi:hypothetical protein